MPKRHTVIMSGSSTGSSTIHQLPNGTLEVLADGTKIQKTDDGVMLCVRPDGTKTQTTADGARLVVHADGSKVQTTSDGTKQEVATDGTITQVSVAETALLILFDSLFSFLWHTLVSSPILIIAHLLHFLFISSLSMYRQGHPDLY